MFTHFGPTMTYSRGINKISPLHYQWVFYQEIQKGYKKLASTTSSRTNIYNSYHFFNCFQRIIDSMISLTQSVFKCFPTQKNISRKSSPKTLNPKIIFFDFSSFSLLKHRQNMKNEGLYSSQILRKSFSDFHRSCHDLQFIHNTNWRLATKSCPNFILWCPDFFRNKSPKTCTKSCHDLTKLCHDFAESSIINLKKNKININVLCNQDGLLVGMSW